MDRDHKRLRRQFAVFQRSVPSLHGPVDAMQKGRWRYFRIPLGLVMVLGSFAAILPVLGLWMLPFGLLLLAVDLPFLRPTVNAVLIRGRRRAELWRRWLRRKRHGS